MQSATKISTRLAGCANAKFLPIAPRVKCFAKDGGRERVACLRRDLDAGRAGLSARFPQVDARTTWPRRGMDVADRCPRQIVLVRAMPRGIRCHPPSAVFCAARCELTRSQQ